MSEVKAHADKGGAVLGICNGFQVLTEAGLLPGALMRNAGLKFVCRPVALKVEETQTCFTRKYEKGQTLSTFPWRMAKAIISPMTRRWTGWKAKAASPSAMREGDNPNGSARNIAGILNEEAQCAGPDAPSRAGGAIRCSAAPTAAPCSRA